MNMKIQKLKAIIPMLALSLAMTGCSVSTEETTGTRETTEATEEETEQTTTEEEEEEEILYGVGTSPLDPGAFDALPDGMLFELNLPMPEDDVTDIYVEVPRGTPIHNEWFEDYAGLLTCDGESFDKDMIYVIVDHGFSEDEWADYIDRLTAIGVRGDWEAENEIYHGYTEEGLYVVVEVYRDRPGQGELCTTIRFGSNTNLSDGAMAIC